MHNFYRFDIIFYMVLTVNLPKKEKTRLTRIALRYGLSLPEFSRRVLQELADEIPEESFEDYSNVRKLKASYKRALADWRTGRISSRL